MIIVMKNKEDRMIDFVAKSYEENRFNPDKALRSIAGPTSVAEPVEAPKHPGNSSYRHFGKLSDRNPSLRHLLVRVAGIAAAVIVGTFLYTSWRTSWTEYMAYDVPQTFTLPDSSSVTLAPGATLRLQRHKDNRLVRMTGKIYFNVRHDDRTPFRIDAGSGFIKVLGTRFQVESRDSVSVSVVSGKVLFSATRSGEEGLVLTKGQSAVLRQDSSAPARLTSKHPNPAAWATGEFIYDNTPLPEVLSELSEYYGVTLVVSDSESRRLSGEFSAASLPDILSLVNSALGISIVIE